MKFDEVEKARVKYNDAKKKIWRNSGFVIIPLIIIFVAMPILSGGLFFILPFTIFFVLVPIAIVNIFVTHLTHKDYIAYKKAYKGYFVERQLKENFTDLQYYHDRGLDRRILGATGMIPTGDHFYSNDLVLAKYKNTGFIQADVHIQNEYTDSDGNTHYTTIFKGRWAIFEFPKKFNFKMMIVPRKRGLGSSLTVRGAKLHRLETESVEFNKLFSIYAEDRFEMFYILDPAFIEKMQTISNEYQNRVYFYFYENHLFVGINDNNDSFEPPKASLELDEKTELEKTAKEIKVITDFVDKLRLDKKLFS